MNETIATPETTPAPEATAPATQGRQPGARTVAIRQLLEASNGEATYAKVKEQLKAQGFEVDPNTFNVTKSTWKRAKLNGVAPKPARKPRAEKGRKGKRPLPGVSLADAVAYVNQVGGLAKAEADVLRRVACVKAFKAFVRQAQRLAS